MNTTPTSKNYTARPPAPGKYPGLILIQEIWGMTDHIKDVSERYAKEGFIVIAPDLLSDSGILEKVSPALFADMRGTDEVKKHAAQAKMREAADIYKSEAFAATALAKMEAVFEELKNDPSCNGNIGTIGFCFGGTYAFHLAVNEPHLKASVVLYGQPPQPFDKVASITCPVLGLYGEQDEHLIKSLPDLTAAMEKYGKDFTSKVYKNCGHAFFNDTNKLAFNKEARDDAWKTSLTFLHKNLD